MTEPGLVMLPYRSPRERALVTLRRQLVIDLALVAVGTLALIPLDGPVPWRVVALGGATLLAKSVAATAAKFDRALEEESVPDGI